MEDIWEERLSDYEVHEEGDPDAEEGAEQDLVNRVDSIVDTWEVNDGHEGESEEESETKERLGCALKAFLFRKEEVQEESQ